MSMVNRHSRAGGNREKHRRCFPQAAYLLAAVLCALLAFTARAEIRPFAVDSLKQIETARQGKAFVLGFWSANCTHCPAELRTLAELARRYPKLDIVLVAADSPAEIPELARLAEEYGLNRQAQWVFADAQPERLRLAIDRRWYGELPRTYLYDRQHRREGRSGVIPAEALERWVVDHVK